MNILMLNNYYYLRGGSERVLFAEKELLTEKGHKVEVLSRRHEGDFASDHYDLFPPDFGLNVRFSVDAVKTAARILYAVDAKRALEALLKRFRPDIVHAHNIHGRLTSSVLDALYRERIPVVMTLHDYKLVCPSYLFLNGGCVCEACKGGRFYMALVNRCVKNSYAASALYACEAYFNKISGKYMRAISTFVSPSLFHLSKLQEFGIPRNKTVNVEGHGISPLTAR